MYHIWGDEDFDWKALGQAMGFIRRFGRFAGLHVMMKEKYGTIRYEFVYLWGFLGDKNFWYDRIGRKLRWITKPICAIQFHWFTLGLYFATKKYPHVAKEILEDWMGHIYGNPWYTRHVYKENPWKSV